MSMGRLGLLLRLISFAVRAMLGVDAGFGEAQALDGTAVNEVLLYNLVDVARVNFAVPDGLGVDDDDGTVLALVEAAGLIGADSVFEACVLDRVFEGGLELLGSLRETAGPGGGFVALVGADEDMVLKKRHLRWILAGVEGCMGVGKAGAQVAGF
jgi:hypothetical protein